MLTVPGCINFPRLRSAALRILDVVDSTLHEVVDDAARAETKKERKQAMAIVTTLARIRVLVDDCLPGLEDDEPEGDDDE